MAFPSAGIGKSGGARVIYLHIKELQTIILVTLYAKSKKSDLSRAEENELRLLASQIRSTFSS